MKHIASAKLVAQILDICILYEDTMVKPNIGHFPEDIKSIFSGIKSVWGSV